MLLKCCTQKSCSVMSHVRFFATPWAVACQALLAMEFSRQEYWSGLPYPTPGHLPDPGIEPRSPELQADFLLSEPPGKPPVCQQVWKTQQWPQDWERSVFIPIPKKGIAKECSDYCTIVCVSQASKVTPFKILQARLQQYMNQELPDVQPGFRKGRRTRDQTASICWIIEKEREFQKSIYF